MQQKLHLALLMLAFVFVNFTVSAQVTTATMTGEVIDNAGEPLIGAAVTALHVPSGVTYGTTTRLDGSYTLPNLRIGGPYTIEASYVGYQTAKIENAQLSLAQKLRMDFTLEEAALSAGEVVVTAKKSDVMNDERTGAATTVTNELINSLPTISRSASDYYRLTPMSDGNSFAGRNDQFNNFSLDGSIFNNPFGLDAATPGGQADAQPISLDAIEQIQVSIAPYDVTQAGFTGAGINAVTKSGTNEFHGTVYGFTRNDGLTGSSVDGTDIIVPELSQNQFGFSLGGPIIKNKLFFFVNAELDRREDAGANVVAARPGLTGANVSRVLASDLDAVRNALLSKGYDPGVYENYTHDTESDKGIIKLDWNINKNHKLTASYNFLDAFKQKPAHPSAIGRRGPDLTTLQFEKSGYQINNKIKSGIVELNSIFGNKFSNKLQLGYTEFNDSRDPFSTAFPVLNINKDGIRYIVAGHEPFSINNRLDQRVLQLTNNFNIFLKGHTLTIGGSFERFEFDNSFNLGVYEPFGVPYAGGTFGPGFGSVSEFVSFVEGGGMDAVIQHAKDLEAANQTAAPGSIPGYKGSGWALAQTNVGQLGLYAQDEWSATDDLRLTLGLRVDMPLYFDTEDLIQENIDRKGGLFADGGPYDPDLVYFDENGNPTTYDQTVLPDNKPLFSPRLGVNYDVGGQGRTQLRGGTGLFSGRLPFVWIGNQVANTDWFFRATTDKDFKFPQVWRSNVGVDHQLNSGWTLSADFIYTKDINGMMVRNYGLGNPSGVLQGVDTRQVYEAADRAAAPFGGPANIYVFSNTDVGRSVNATLQAQKRFSNGMYVSLAYNFLDAQDASSIEAEISGDAYDRNPALGNVNNAVLSPSLYGNKHRIVGAASRKFSYSGGKLATTISLFAEYAQGGRFSYTYSGDINNDGSGLNDLIYIPTDAQIDQMIFSGDAAQQASQRAGLKEFIAQDEYLSDNRGSYMEKYGILNEWYSNWDLRILQDFNFGAKKNNTIQLSIDVLNIGNLISDSWGVRTLPVNTQPIGVSVDENNVPTYSFDSSLQNTFANDFGLNSRWQMQFGLRYIF